MIHCQRCGATVSPEVSAWLENMDDRLYGEFVKVGFVEARKTAELEPFLTDYIAGRNDVKPSTLVRWRQDVNKLVAFFGSKRRVETVTPREAELFKQFLWGQGLAQTTISKHLSNVKMFFDKMQQAGLLRGSNPFEGVKERAVVDESRNEDVPRESAFAAMEASPDHEWALMIALCRFGGLRCPSEVLSLQWDGVNFEKKEILVLSPKTERHAHGAQRVIPMFPELFKPLQIAWEERPEGAEFVISKHRSQADNPVAMKKRGWAACNLRKPFLDILHKAGITPWKKLFHAMRAAFETDLFDAGYPPHEVARWMD